MASFWKKPLGSTGDKIVKVVEDAYKDVGNAVEVGLAQAGNVVNNIGATIADAAPDIDIAKEDLSLKGIGKVAGNAASTFYSTVYLGAINVTDKYITNGNINKLSGGLLTDANKAAGITNQLAAGKGIEDNLKSGVRVGIVAGAGLATGGSAGVVAAYGTSQATVGLSSKSWAEVLVQGVGTFVPAAGKVAAALFLPATEYNTTYTPSDAGAPITLQNVVDSKVVKIIMVTLVCAGLIIILKKKKKK